MRYPILPAVIVALVAVATVQAQDGLFSEVAMEAVFDKSAASDTVVATKRDPGKLTRITGVSTLILALEAAGLESKERDARATFNLDHERWSFPVSIGVQVDQDQMDCRMSLVNIKDDSSLTASTLLRLLASGDPRGTSFAYDPAKKLLQVRTTLPNRSITATELKASLVHMATVAAKHSDLWEGLQGETNNDSSLAAKPAQTQVAQPKTTSTTPPRASAAQTVSPAKSPQSGTTTPRLSLLGRWTASLSSGQAFAIELTTDSKFQLVHLKSGKSTVSKGKATRSGNRLTLVGDGITINGNIVQTKADTFQLQITDAKGNVSLKLDFKKAKA